MLVECEKDDDGEPKDIRGSSARQSDMLLWRRMDLIGCTRGGSKSDNVVNGALYVVERVSATDVTMRIHEDYSRLAKFDTPENREALRPFLSEVMGHLTQPRTPKTISGMASTELFAIMTVITINLSLMASLIAMLGGQSHGRW